MRVHMLDTRVAKDDASELFEDMEAAAHHTHIHTYTHTHIHTYTHTHIHT